MISARAAAIQKRNALSVGTITKTGGGSATTLRSGFKTRGYGGGQTAAPATKKTGTSYGSRYIGASTAFGKRSGGYSIFTPAAPKAVVPDPRINMFKDLMAKMEASSESARTANIARRDKISSMYDDIISGIQKPTGTEDEAFRASTEQQMEATKKSDVGAGAQRLISSGLYGTEQAGGLEQKWEADVGVGQRMKMEDIISQRGEERENLYTQRQYEAKTGKAGFLERIEEEYPDYQLLAQLAAQIGNV